MVVAAVLILVALASFAQDEAPEWTPPDLSGVSLESGGIVGATRDTWDQCSTHEEHDDYLKELAKAMWVIMLSAVGWFIGSFILLAENDMLGGMSFAIGAVPFVAVFFTVGPSQLGSEDAWKLRIVESVLSVVGIVTASLAAIKAYGSGSWETASVAVIGIAFSSIALGVSILG
jgi:hypothetical protein